MFQVGHVLAWWKQNQEETKMIKCFKSVMFQFGHVLAWWRQNEEETKMIKCFKCFKSRRNKDRSCASLVEAESRINKDDQMFQFGHVLAWWRQNEEETKMIKCFNSVMC